MDQPAVGELRVQGAYLIKVTAEDADFGQLLERDQTGTQAVIDIVVVVGNLIRQVGDLGFQAGLPPFQEAEADIAEFFGIFFRTVLEDALARFEGEIEAIEFGVFLLQFVHHP